MAAGKAELLIEQGATFHKVLRCLQKKRSMVAKTSVAIPAYSKVIAYTGDEISVGQYVRFVETEEAIKVIIASPTSITLQYPVKTAILSGALIYVLAVVDITGYTARGQVRLLATDEEALVTFDCEVTDPVNGEITVDVPYDETEDIPTPGKTSYDKYLTAYYDIELVGPNGVRRLLNDKIFVSPEVTK